MKLFNRCYLGGNKHKFEPRYTEKESSGNDIYVEKTTLTSFRKLLYHQEYVGDVCVWCGKIINNQN